MNSKSAASVEVEHRGKKRVKFMADHHGTQDQTGKMRQRTQGNLKFKLKAAMNIQKWKQVEVSEGSHLASRRDASWQPESSGTFWTGFVWSENRRFAGATSVGGKR